MEADPFQGNVKALQGEEWTGVFRRCIGDYRLLFTVDRGKSMVHVARILVRSGKTSVATRMRADFTKVAQSTNRGTTEALLIRHCPCQNWSRPCQIFECAKQRGFRFVVRNEV